MGEPLQIKCRAYLSVISRRENREEELFIRRIVCMCALISKVLLFEQKLTGTPKLGLF